MILLLEGSADPSNLECQRQLNMAAQLFDFLGERPTASNLFWAAANWNSLDGRPEIDPAWTEVARIMVESEPTTSQILRLGELITAHGVTASKNEAWTTGADLQVGTWSRLLDTLHLLTESAVALSPKQASRLLDSLDAATGSLDCDGPATSSLRRPRDIDDLRSIWAAGAAAANESTHLFLGWQLSRAMQRFGAGAMEQFVLELSGDQQTDAALRTCLVIANDETVSALLLWELQRLDNAVLDLSINLGEFVP